MKRECDFRQINDDRQLKFWLKQVTAEDANALLNLYNALFDPLCLFVLTILGSYSEAEDILQETFIRVYQNAGQFEEKSSAKTWIFSIAKNLCLDTLKKDRTHEIQGDIPKTTDTFSELESAEALACLDAKERQVIVLHIFGGLRITEIAALLSMTERQAYYCRKQAYQKLRLYYIENF